MPVVERRVSGSDKVARPESLENYRHATERLIAVVQQLSLARDIQSVMDIVRRAARELTGADGSTFVMRDCDQCYYADEDAIEPLWKGLRFPMTACISGWAMLNRESVVIEDIYLDSRIPIDAYRPTFVKSLAMVPIRTLAPVGAIGNYWAKPHRATAEEMALLQALADSTSIALENIHLYDEMEQRVKDRTAELAAANKELEAFSFSVSHDLRAPLRVIDGFSRMLAEGSGHGLDDEGRALLARIRSAAENMSHLIEALLQLARLSRADLVREHVDLTQMAKELAAELKSTAPDRSVTVDISEGVAANGDPGLLRIVLDNLLSNAWKYTSKRSHAHIRFSCRRDEVSRSLLYYVQDDGAGFDMRYAQDLFGAFRRLHTQTEFPGTGVGLATVQRIVQRHGGRIWAEAEIGKGATFYFTLG